MKCLERYRDKEKARAYRNRHRAKNYGPSFPRKMWTTKEEKFIIESDLSDRELSQRLKRSIRSIQVKRSRRKYDRNYRTTV